MEKELSMEDFLEEIDNSFRRLERGDIVEGAIVSITETELVMGLEVAQDGVIPKAESGVPSGVALKDSFEIGQRCSAVITHPNHPDGYVELSIKKAMGQVEQLALEEAFAKQSPIDIQVLEEIKGGYRITFGTTQGFMPFSQSGIMRDASSEVLFTAPQTVLVTEYGDKKFVVSRRAIIDAKKAVDKKNRLEGLKEGEVVDGTVIKLMPFGAFVDLGGVEGLIPMGEMGWKRISDAAEVLSVGQQVTVKVRSIQHEAGRISLSLKDLIQNPNDDMNEDFTVGEKVQCSIRGILAFGLKVELPNGAQGFIHKSELELKDPNVVLAKHFNVGDTLSAEIIDFDQDRKQVVLSCLEQADGDFESYLEPEADTAVTLGDLFKAKFEKLNQR